MARRGSYIGVADPDQRFEAMREPLGRLRALELAHGPMTPAGAALDHAIVSIRLAANLLTRQNEFFNLAYHYDEGQYRQALAELEAARPALVELRRMADAFHPATPESRALNHAAGALRMAANVISGDPDFYRMTVGDGTTAARR